MSINEIAKALPAAKSSVSMWVRGVELTKTQKEQLRRRTHSPVAIEKRRQSRLSSEKTKRDLIANNAFNDIGSLSDRELWLVGTSLYWAEGGKTQRTVRFSNGDPEMIKLMMRYFRKSCKVPEDKFRGYIHIHDSLDHIAAEKYWSRVSNIKLNKFYKTYRKPNPSSKGLRQTLPYGVLDIYVADYRLFLKIKGWTKGIYHSK